MKKYILFAAVISSLSISAKEKSVVSPDGNLKVTISDEGGTPSYVVTLGDKTILQKSYLGLKTDIIDFTTGMKMISEKDSVVNKHFTMTRGKQENIYYNANLTCMTFEKDKKTLDITFSVSNDGVAFKYAMPQYGDIRCVKIYSEASSFRFPDNTTTFLCPQITPMEGWMQTKPSYEEEYKADAPMTDKSQFGVGYTFPCLFKIGNDGWALVSETGVRSSYCGSRLSDFDKKKGYTIAFPMQGENNGIGFEGAAAGLPCETPWRTLAIGNNLKPIVETNLQFQLVDQLYEPSKKYEPARYTWSWLIWQDNSINYNDQVKMIDLASEMGYESVLVDNYWDTRIGYKGIEKLAAYAKSKNVKLMLWYNSNGYENNAPQGPRNVMNNIIARKRDMKWMKSIGIAGIKVDFFGGDKQETMKLYEDILSDANDYGLEVIFHGATMPRGWERMFPNFVGSEASLASENLFFTQHHCDEEGFQMTIHPFLHNAVASFDWGGVILNHRMNRDNNSRHYRRTSDVFELATAITNQQYVNCIAIYPNNLDGMKTYVKDFLKEVPTSWQETKFLDGYPSQYFAVARRSGNKWYAAAINGKKETVDLELDLPMFAGKTVTMLYDSKKKGDKIPEPMMKQVKVDKNGKLKVSLQPLCGIVLR